MRLLLNVRRFCVACIILIAVAHLQNCRIWTLADNTNPVCNTPECQKLGTVFGQYMNPNGQPCTDFYDYVCHNWGNINPRPKEISDALLWNIEQSLQFRALLDLRTLLENKNRTSEDFERAKLLYRMCRNIPLLPRFNGGAVRNIMKKIGDFPTLLPNNNTLLSKASFWEIHQQYLKLTGESAFFDFRILYHPLLSHEIITEFAAPTSPYGALKHSAHWSNETELIHYRSFLKNLIRSLAEPNSPISPEQINSDINDVMLFREKLNQNVAFQRFAHHQDRILTLEEFQIWYKSKTKSADMLNVNWPEMIRTLYINSSGQHSLSITEKSMIDVEFNYVSKLVDLLEKIPKRVIVNHMHLYFAERHVQWDSQMKVDLKGSIMQYSFVARDALRTGPYRWKSCVESIDMQPVMEKEYLKSHFQKKDKSKVQELFGTSKKLLEQMISESTWLASGERKTAINKVRKLKGLIGYPDWYDTNVQPTSHSDDMEPLDSDAHYSNNLNQISVSAVYLQWPIYIPNVPYVIDYGATVNIFGHELHHAFDSDGVSYNAEGYSSWLSAGTISKYEGRTKCFKNQFDKIKTNEMNKLKKPTSHNVIFENTVDEDMADVMGLKLSYLGFKQMLNKNKRVCPVLPGFANFSCEQLFFITFANGFCSSLTPRQQEAILYEDTHNLPSIRVNGAVANMKEFSAAFGCKPNDPLNLKETCDLWK